MARLVFVRHGQTLDNVQRLFSGHRETELTEVGIEQAREVNLALDIVPDVIFSSPRQRCVDTARIVMNQLGIAGREIVISDLLDERFFGELEGRSQEGFPDETDRTTQLKMWEAGAESLSDVYHRAQRFLALVEQVSPVGDVLAFGHASSGRALVRASERLVHDASIPSMPHASPIDIARRRLVYR